LVLPVLLLLATLLCLLQQPVLHVLQPLLQQGFCCSPLAAAAGGLCAFLLLAVQLLLQVCHLLLCVLPLPLQLCVLCLPVWFWPGTQKAKQWERGWGSQQFACASSVSVCCCLR
jgi:hypothetical protein